MSREKRSDQPPPPVVLWTLWWAITVTPLIYLFLGLAVLRDSAGDLWRTDSFYPTMRLTFISLAVVFAFGSQFLYLLVLWPKIQAAKTREGFLRQFQISLLIRCALLEAIAIFGLLLFILFGRTADLVGFCVGSLVFLIATAPVQMNRARELPSADDSR